MNAVCTVVIYGIVISKTTTDSSSFCYVFNSNYSHALDFIRFAFIWRHLALISPKLEFNSKSTVIQDIYIYTLEVISTQSSQDGVIFKQCSEA